VDTCFTFENQNRSSRSLPDRFKKNGPVQERREPKTPFTTAIRSELLNGIRFIDTRHETRLNSEPADGGHHLKPQGVTNQHLTITAV
jgi:hypothetical protein